MHIVTFSDSGEIQSRVVVVTREPESRSPPIGINQGDHIVSARVPVDEAP